MIAFFSMFALKHAAGTIFSISLYFLLFYLWIGKKALQAAGTVMSFKKSMFFNVNFRFAFIFSLVRAVVGGFLVREKYRFLGYF